jgi:hypothetical protein
MVFPVRIRVPPLLEFPAKHQKKSREGLLEALGTAISAITDQDARGFFEHCGYRAMVQLF